MVSTLETAVGRKRNMAEIGGHGAGKTFVVTLFGNETFFPCSRCVKNWHGLL